MMDGLLHHFHFIRPLFLCLVPLTLFLFFYFCKRIQRQHWRHLLDKELIPYMIQGTVNKHNQYLSYIFMLAMLLVIIALAGPTWQQQEKPIYQSDSALVILLDLSLSMLAEDVSPSRIERAKYKIRDLLKLRTEGETALIAYAGDAFTVTPLTDDVDTISNQLSALTPEVMPVLGYRADIAMTQAKELLKGAGYSEGDVFIITDQINPARDIEKASALQADGYRVSVMAVGTESASPIPLPNGQYLRINNEIVVPNVNFAVLQELSVEGGGVFYSMRLDDGDIKHFVSILDHQQPSEQQDSTFTSDQWIEQGPWLLLLVIPIFAVGFRKGVLYSLIIFLLPIPQPVHAFDWQSLWLNANQRGQHLLEQKSYEQAGRTFKNKDWQSVAKYRAGDYQGAIDLLADNASTTARYNRATALAKSGQLEQALEAYEQLLAHVPEHKDAQYNRDLIEQALQQQNQQQNTSESDSGNQQQDSQEQEGAKADSNAEQPEDAQQGESSAQEQASSEQSQASEQQTEQQSLSESDPQHSEQEEHSLAQQEQADEQQSDQQQAMMREDDNKNHEDESDAEDSAAEQSSIDIQTVEQQQAVEQWLRRIPDDPSGLLKRKFYYQYQKRRPQRSAQQQW